MSVKELQSFVRKYCLTAELLIFKYRWQNISVSNTALGVLAAITGSEVTCVDAININNSWYFLQKITFFERYMVQSPLSDQWQVKLYFNQLYVILLRSVRFGISIVHCLVGGGLLFSWTRCISYHVRFLLGHPVQFPRRCCVDAININNTWNFPQTIAF